MFSVFVLVAMSLGSGRQTTPPELLSTPIFVEPMGTDHEAVYFRRLLTDHLRRAGRATADTPTSQLVLATTLSTPVVSGETRAYATAELRAADGRVLWSSEFPANDGWRQARGRDALTKLAEEIATALARRPS